jgi:NifU-like protein involved in Fe-S cluster formation
MNVSVSYNEAVRRHFADPQHAGDLRGAFEGTLAADVSDSDKGAQVIITAGIRDGNIAEIRFRVWGCPHLIAALESACRLPGRRAGGALGPIRQRGYLRKLPHGHIAD